MFAHGEHIRQHLRGMELVGEAIVDRNTGVLCQLLHGVLAKAAVFDGVEHPAQNTGGVGDGLFFADLRAGGVEIGDAHAHVVGSDLKRAAGAGGGLFKDQGNVLALPVVNADIGLLFGLETLRQIQQIQDFLRCKVQQF